jgi:DNA-binding CsgD family transcriptional regulator
VGASGAGLLERAEELAQLRGALVDAARGRGRVVLVDGPAGAGKTSLLRAAAAHAEGLGFAVYRATAGEFERDFAYGCLRQLLEARVVAAPDGERARLFAGAAAAAAALFAADTGPPNSPFATLHGLYWLINNLAEDRPIVLAVDDVQWADAESARLLGYLAPRLDGLALAVLVARRTGEATAAELARLALAGGTTVLHPRPLTAAGTAAFCAERMGHPVAPEFALACQRATGGNPFFLDALLRETRERGLTTDADGAAMVARVGPASVAVAVLLRIAGAHPGATELVRAVAVLGDGASLAEAAQLGGLDLAEAAAAADLLAKLEVLDAERGLAFAHPIVREAVYADTGTLRRRRMHADAARQLAARGVAGERVAAQIVAAEPEGDAERVMVLRRVAAAALRRGAPSAAEAWLRRALAEPPLPEQRADVLVELGEAALRLASPSAVEHLGEAAGLQQDPRHRARTARLHALALTVSVQSEQSVAVLGAVADDVAPIDRELGLLLEADLAAHAHQAGPDAVAAAGARLRRHVGLAGKTPGERLAGASLAFERARVAPTAAAAVAEITAVLDGGRLVTEQELDVVGPFYHLMLTLLGTDALDDVDAALSLALADARTRGSVPALIYVNGYRARLALRRGALGQAEADARIAIELMTAHDIPFGRWPLYSWLAEVLVGAGDVAGAERAMRESGTPADVPPGLTDDMVLPARAALHLAAGRLEAGIADLVESGRRAEGIAPVHPLASRWRSLAALALVAAGRREQAVRLAGEDLDRARQWGTASGIGTALRAAAAAEGGAIQRLEEAVGVLEGSPARLEHARALVELGAALRRANRRAEARGPLQGGRAAALACGAAGLAEEAGVELRAAGGRTTDPTRTGVEQLTASERRIAELAADGLSNPEIAQTLFVTRKTVETHLGKVYLKLGIGGRGELAAALEPTPTAP